jgi:hypothetical protein
MPADKPDQSVTELEIEVYKSVRAHELMLAQVTRTFEQATIAPLFVLNGGAVVAFLTLLGAVSSDKSRLSVTPALAAIATGAWAIGLLSAAMAALHSLDTQRSLMRAQATQRRQLEHSLLNDHLADIVAGPADHADPNEYWRAQSKAWSGAIRVERLHTASVACFLAGALFAGLSVL